MEKEDIISSGILEAYVMGISSPEEIDQLQTLRIQHPELNAEIARIEEAMESYAMANGIAPAPGIKDKIFSSLNLSEAAQTQSSAKIVSFSPLSRIAAAAAILLLLVSNVFYYNKYKNVDSKYQEGQEQLASMNTHLTEMNRDMNIVQSKYSKPVALDGLEAAPDAAAKIFWMKNTGEVYVDPGNMPMAPTGKQYQLWAIVDGKPVDGGMITSKDGKKYSIQKMKTFGKAQAFEITLESEGGNPEPKGTMYIMGKI